MPRVPQITELDGRVVMNHFRTVLSESPSLFKQTAGLQQAPGHPLTELRPGRDPRLLQIERLTAAGMLEVQTLMLVSQ